MSSKLNRQRRILWLLIIVTKPACRSRCFRFFRAGFRLSIMTGTADGVEKACLLAFGDRAEIEEDGPALNAGNHRRVASSQGAGPRPFRVMSGREWWADAHGHCRNGLHRHAPSPDE